MLADNLFQSSDIFLVGALICSGLEPVAETTTKGVVSWFFNTEATAIVREYQRGALKISALEFQAVVRGLRESVLAARAGGRHHGQ